MKKVTRKMLSLLLAVTMMFGMVQGAGILPVFAAGAAPTVSIGSTTLQDGKYYTQSAPPTDAAPTDGTPYLYYNGGVLTVTGDFVVNAITPLPSPVKIQSGTLTIAGSGSLTLESPVVCVDFAPDTQLALSGKVNFTAKSNTATPAMSSGSFRTADGYSGDIRLESEGSVLSHMKGIDLNTTGSIVIYGDKSSAPIVSCDESIQMTGAGIEIKNRNLSDPASNGILVNGAKDLSLTATAGGLKLKMASSHPVLNVNGNITLSAVDEVSIQNYGTDGSAVNWGSSNGGTGSKFSITQAKYVEILGRIIVMNDQSNNIDIQCSGPIQQNGGISLGSTGTCTVKSSDGNIGIVGEGNEPVFSGKTLTLDADKEIVVQRKVDTGSVPIIAANEQQLTSKNSVVVISGSAGSTVKAKDGQTIQAAFGGQVTDACLDLSTLPAEATFYLAGEGYILYTPAQNGNPAVLALTNATIDTIVDEAITLPNTAVTMQLSGKSILRSNASDGSGIQGTGSVTITSSNGGTLDIEANAYALSFEKAYGKTITIGGNATVTAVSHNGPAVMAGGSLTVEPDAKFAAKGMGIDVLIDGAFQAPNFNGSVMVDNQTATPKTFDFTVYGTYDIPGMLANMPIGTSMYGAFSLHIPSGSQMTVSSGLSLVVTDMTKLKLEGKLVNNGIIYLPVGTTVDQIKIMKLPGAGFVFVPENVDGNGMPSKDKGTAYTNDGVELKTVSGGLTLTDTEVPASENKGYIWTKSGEGNSEVWTLTLNHTCINGNLTLPDKTVVINTTADSLINGDITLGSSSSGNLTFTGSGSLAVDGSISGSQGGSVMVAEKANVIVSSGISVSTSGGVNGALIVNGTLTASSTLPSAVICTGKAEIGPAGVLNVTGESGLKLNGMNPDGKGTVYSDAFVMKKGGKLNANCTESNVTVFTGTNEATKENASKVIVLPDNYLPSGYEIATVSGVNGGQIQYAYTIAPKDASLILEAEQVMGAGGKLMLAKPLPIVSDVTVSPSTMEVKKGNSQVFSANVTGKYDFTQSVTWSISGNKSQNTTIDQNGKLTVAADETAATITVTATSTSDTSKFGTTIVTVTGSTENGGTDNNGSSGTNGNNTNTDTNNGNTNPAQPVPPESQDPATDSNENEQTGDTSRTVLPAAVVSMLSLIAVLFILRRRKRT